MNICEFTAASHFQILPSFFQIAFDIAMGFASIAAFCIFADSCHLDLTLIMPFSIALNISLMFLNIAKTQTHILGGLVCL